MIENDHKEDHKERIIYRRNLDSGLARVTKVIWELTRTALNKIEIDPIS